jgi:hypothetical protein
VVCTRGERPVTKEGEETERKGKREEKETQSYVRLVPYLSSIAVTEQRQRGQAERKSGTEKMRQVEGTSRVELQHWLSLYASAYRDFQVCAAPHSLL